MVGGVLVCTGVQDKRSAEASTMRDPEAGASRTRRMVVPSFSIEKKFGTALAMVNVCSGANGPPSMELSTA